MKEHTDTGFGRVFRREWGRMARSKIVLWGMFAMPLIAVLIFIPMMDSGLPTRIPIAVVDGDNSAISRALVRQLETFPKTGIAARPGTFTEARKLMESGEVFAILEIPGGFSRDASTGRRPQLTYYTNNAFLINGSLLFQDMKTASVLASASVGLKMGDAEGRTTRESMQAAQPVVIESHPLGNPSLNYSIYLNNMLLPGVLQLIIIMFTVSAFGSEVKSGTGRAVVEMAGGRFTAVAAKLLPYTIVFTAIGLMFCAVLYGVNHFPLRGGLWPMGLDYLLLVLASQGVGLIILGIFRNYRFSLSAGCLIGMLSIPVSGFSFPATAMYGAMKAWGCILPLRHFFLNYTDQALNGIAFGYSAAHYAALMCFALAGLLFFRPAGDILENDVYKP